MHLKSIELENFKSFKGEVTIPYESGFTAITGPNGSGKSNCGDAIQFVLGPRSAKSLRAQNVKDLIFNGGKKDKAARSCTATLVFDNPADAEGARRLKVDTDEVRFTRTVRLNRKNDANTSYYLNERPSTSTEFRRLLTEAGARGDGYNIVLQGDVTGLATMSSRERRKVLDDVAGVTAYDDEIKRADRQRKRVEEYLERIGLLEEELSVRLKTLSKEREQALKYRELKVALENARITVMHARHRSSFNEIQMIADERASYLERIEVLSKTISAASADLMEVDEQLVEIERQLNAVLGDDGKALSERLRGLEVDVETRKDRVGDAEAAIEEAHAEIEQLQKEGDDASAALESHLEGLKAAEEAVVKADADLAAANAEEKQARDTLAAGDRATHDLNRAFGKATEAVAKFDEARGALALDADRAANQVEMADERVAECEEVLENARLTRDDLVMQGEEMQQGSSGEDRGALAEALTKLQRDERALMDQVSEVERKAAEAERSLARAKAEMENRSGAKAGMAQAVAAVMALRDSGELRGILGPLGQLCAPKDSDHEEALAYALGGGMNSIVVRDDEIAATCIKWLRDNHAGRATFLPLNKLQSRRPGGKALMTARQDGVVGFAFDLLEYDESIESAVKHAVRDTLIVRDMGTARRHMGGVRMVTLDGSVTEASGAMVGGAVRGKRPQFGGNIAGMGAVERASAEVDKFEMLVETVRGALAECRNQQHALRERINALSDGDESVKLRNWQEDMKRAQQDFESAENKLKVALSQLAEAKNVLAKAAAKAEKAESDHAAALEARQQAAASLQASSPAHLSELLQRVEGIRTTAMEAKIAAEQKLAAGQATTELLERNVGEITRRIGEQNAIAEKSRERVAKLTAEIEALSAELAEVSEAHAQVAEEHRELDERRLTLRDERSSLKSALEHNSSQRETLRTRCNDLNGEIEMKRRQLEELTAEMASLEITPADAEIDLPSIGDAENSVRNIERRVANLGDVNMLSIEQYDVAEERLSQIATDAKELRARRTALVDLAEKLEGERKDRLTTVLSMVSDNFKRVYERLSDGGKAELRLENPKDPFSAGLEMWCQPQGKSSKSKLSLLSGGEKSMAALALIFAIQDYDPSPFYYFDEVDQNLDAYNAEHIARLCRLRSQRAQFIMVTLRKVSLQLADHHIGITHAGDGCSRRITDFDREQALEMGDAAEAELAHAQKLAEEKTDAIKRLPKAEDMARAPEELPTPPSLGGADLTDAEADPEAEAEEPETMSSLAERAEEWREDMEEANEVVLAQEQADRDEMDARIAAEEGEGDVEAEAPIEVESPEEDEA